MSNEVQFAFPAGRTCYYLLRNSVSQIWSNSGAGGFGNYSTPQYADYVNEMTQQGVAAPYYVGDLPANLPAGLYSITGVNQIGGSPAETDPFVATGDLNWNGSQVIPLSDLATSGQIGQIAPIRMARGVMVQNFPFKMVSSADHVTPFTSGVISGQISRDGAAFGPLQSGTITEIGLGAYRVTLTSGDLLCNTAYLSFNGVGISGGAADQRDFSFILQRVSGQ